MTVIAPEEAKSLLRSLVLLKPGEYLRSWIQYNQNRGMNRWRDIIDWVGGYPYEVATPEQIFDFYRSRGFRLTRVKCGGVVSAGCYWILSSNLGAGTPVRGAIASVDNEPNR